MDANGATNDLVVAVGKATATRALNGLTEGTSVLSVTPRRGWPGSRS